MIARTVIGKGVSGAVRYVTGEGRNSDGEHAILEEGKTSRVAWIGGTGFGFDIESKADAELARKIMEFDALHQGSKTRKCEKDCVHIALGWRPGENPTRADMELAAKGALKALGMENAKAIFASHTDESYSHIHIVASKLNPDTGKTYDLRGNYLKLSRWAEAHEREHGGVVCLRREDANRLRDAIAARNPTAVIDALTQQRPTFTEAELDRALKKQLKGTVTRAGFRRNVVSHPEIVKLRDEKDGPTTRYTTRTILKAEQYVIAATDTLSQNQRHDSGDRARTDVLRRPAFSTIRPEQAHAVREATGAAGIALIDGQAGTGKSYTISAIRQVYETAGHTVVGLAPTNVVAQDMQRDGFRKATTVHSALYALNNKREFWNSRTVVILDEAAMVDTKLMAMLTTQARAVGAKLILVGDDRQLASIERGGMFGALKNRYGAASLSEVTRQHKDDDRRASSMMSEGNFHDALKIYEAKGAINWSQNQAQTRAALVKQWANDTAAFPNKSRFVFAYTNADVAQLNADIRAVRRARGELGQDHMVKTAEGNRQFASGDRVQLTATNKSLGLYNSMIGTVEKIEGTEMTVKFDGRKPSTRTIDTKHFGHLRHGYAGTIYKGQGRTLDQTYLYHSEHWRIAASYVALTRHREMARIFVARNTAPDVRQLARQMARVDDRRAASHFYHNEAVGAFSSVRAVEPSQVAADLGIPGYDFPPSPLTKAPKDVEEPEREADPKPTAKPAQPVRSAAVVGDIPSKEPDKETTEAKPRADAYTNRPPIVLPSVVKPPPLPVRPKEEPAVAFRPPERTPGTAQDTEAEERVRRVMGELDRNSENLPRQNRGRHERLPVPEKERAASSQPSTHQELKAEQAEIKPMTPEEQEQERVRRVMLEFDRNAQRITRSRGR